jgi:hypothetical protein
LLLRFVQFKVTIDTLQRIVKNRYKICSAIHYFICLRRLRRKGTKKI